MDKLEGQIRIPSGCAISAVIARDGQRMTGEKIIESMRPMHDRSNGLGGGFAAYGIYPEYRDFFALHMFLEDRTARKNCEAFLRETMEIVHLERIPIRTTPAITGAPPDDVRLITIPYCIGVALGVCVFYAIPFPHQTTPLEVKLTEYQEDMEKAEGKPIE